MAKEKYGGIDVCVNNAGLAHQAPLLSGSTDDWRDMVEVWPSALHYNNVSVVDQSAGVVCNDERVDEAD